MEQQPPILQSLVSSLVSQAPHDGFQGIIDSVMKGEHNPEADVARGVVAGLAGGLVGAFAKTIIERIFPIKPADPATRRAVTLGDTEIALNIDTRDVVTGILIGGAYGAAAELAPDVTAANGLGLGSAVYGINNAGQLMEADKVTLSPNQENEAHELLSDIVYGLVVEYVRTQVRARLN